MNPKFRKISTLEGLSQNDVNCVFQDSRGFIWIGTNDGLNRYDGYDFKIFQTEPGNPRGIPSNLIFRIQEDLEGNLWLGTSDKGLIKYNVRKNTFHSLSELTDGGAANTGNRVNTLFIDSRGVIWFGSDRGLELIIPGERDTYTLRIFSDSENEKNYIREMTINNVYEDTDGLIIVSTGDGFYFFSNSEQENGSYTFSLDHNIYINAFKIFRYENNYLMHSIAGINLITIDKKNSAIQVGRNMFSQAIRFGTFDSKGNYWGGSPSNGLYQLEFSTAASGDLQINEKAFYGEDDFGNSTVTSLFEDDDGLVWIGINGSGVFCFVPHSERFRLYRKTEHSGSLGYNKIRAIYEDSNNNLWIGTEGGGMSLLPQRNSRAYSNGFIHKPEIRSETEPNHVYCFREYFDKKHVLAGANYNSLLLELTTDGTSIISNRSKYTNQLRSVFDLHVDTNGVVWIASYSAGLYLIYPAERDKPEKIVNIRNDPNNIYSISSDVLRSIYEDKQGNIWIGSDKGLNKLQESEKYSDSPRFIVYKNDVKNTSSISHNYILPIFQSKSNEMWFGTMGGGLNKYVPAKSGLQDRFEAFTTENGLPSNVIKAILEDDDGNLWLSSNRGLSKFNPENYNIINYDINDGLQDYEFSELAAFKRKDGELLFGGVNGFNAFYPSEINLDPEPPKMAITEFMILNNTISVGQKFNGRVILNESVNSTKHIKLKYSENSLAFHFSALHFAAPDKNQYRYKLIGFDEKWIRTSSDNRIAKYTYLPPGDYTFILEGTNLDGVWCDKPSLVRITVVPPWWRSTIAFISYSIGFVLIILALIRYAIARSHRRTELEMERFEKIKVKELSDMKLRFFTNISHEFRTPLTLILGPLEKLISQGERYNEKRRQESYSIIQRNAAMLLRLINQLMDFRKFEQGKMKLLATNSDLLSFVSEIFHSFEEYAQRKKISFIKKVPDKKIELWFDRDKLEKILYNLLSNAFKFTPSESTIELSVFEHIDFITIAVRDTGIGMSEEMQRHVFERFYQSKRIRNRRTGSTGIGLSFTKGLVELHHGKIDFESKINEGTTFFIELPKGDLHLSEEDKLSDFNIKEEQYLPLDGKQEFIVENNSNEDTVYAQIDIQDGPGILVVEDNYDLRKFLHEQLNPKYTVYEAVDGEQGFDLSVEMQPDIIISDIMMPGMDGFELCTKLKSDERTSHIPVVLLTAKTSDEYQVKGFRTGADAYVTKPFQISILEARIQAILSSREKLRSLYQKSVDIKPSEVAMTSTDQKFLEKIVRIVEENMAQENFTVEQLSSEYGMTQTLLNKKLRSFTGLTSKAFIRSIRMKRAAQLLSLGRYTVAGVTYEVGMNDLKYFRQCFKAEFGVTPSEYMKAKKNHSPESTSDDSQAEI